MSGVLKEECSMVNRLLDRKMGKRLVRSVLGGFAAMVIAMGTAAQADAATPKVGDTAPDFELETLDGARLKLSALSQQGPVVLVVLRGYPGYQCPVCTAQVGDLLGKSRQFQAARSRVVLVYPGPSEELKNRAAEFVRGKSLPENFDLVLDPDFAFTASYGLRWDAPNETAYPSTFVLDENRVVRFAKISRSHGGRAKASEVIDALSKSN
jgi:peroxiredoxin